MCGIAGILSLNRNPIDPYAIKRMCDIVAHRGPDDAGYVLFSLGHGGNKRKNFWLELTDNQFKHKNVHLAPIESDFAKAQIEQDRWHLALGHRRLAIIDLSPKAHQPMSNRSRTIWVTYNGEVYNFKELRKELEGKGYAFYSNSDTEVIIRSYQEWGIDCIRKFNGMFAFALWDSTQNKLYLCRDRYGVKPLYYYFHNGLLIFASEIKSILTIPKVKREVDYHALNEYFTFQNILSDKTLFKNIKLLKPGCYVYLDLEKPITNDELPIINYWDYHFSSENFMLSKKETADKLRHLFEQAVRRQLISDVPIGSYLSGGMDTGSIAAIARKHLGRICTFTVGFDLSSASGLELGFDERKYSEILANLLKTEHYEVVLHAGDMEQVMPELIWHLEDLRVGQCYPNYYAARLVGKFVKVVLSGGGGDELFGGYPWRYYRGINSINRRDYSRKYYEYWQRLVSEEAKRRLFNEESYKNIKNYPTFEVFTSVLAKNGLNSGCNYDYINDAMYFEIKTFLHGLFVVEDKMSMAHSLETRVPFMDNDLVEFAMQIPVTFKLKNLDQTVAMDENELGKLRKYYEKTKDGKIILRQAMQKLIPKKILKREKQGFSAPDASWFRGESIEYIKSMLLKRDARIYNFLNPTFVRSKIEEHVSGQVNHRLLIWSLLSFEWWNRKFLDE